MPAFRARLAVPLLLLLATVSACASDSDPKVASDPGTTTSSSSPAALEAITAQGVAGVVRDALGAETIESYSPAGEGDSIGVLVKLAGRQRLVVSVQIKGKAPLNSCDDIPTTAIKSPDCVEAADGTITASGTAEPFSDDNTHGSTVLAQSVNPKTDRVVYALYETYSTTPTLDPKALADIVSDPALAAMTDPATNDAGKDIELTAAN